MRTRLRNAAYRAGERLDRVFVRAAFRSGRASRRAAGESGLDYLEAAPEHYHTLARRGRLFPEPSGAPRPKHRRVRALDGGEVVDLSWPSAWKPLHPKVAAVMEGNPHNAFAQARWYRHTRPAPVLIAIHGWGVGYYPVEERAWRADGFYRRGYDLVLFTLPYHARRRRQGFGMPAFPSPDPYRTTEGFAQAIHDLRELVLLLREHGAPAVMVAGMSLGGFTTSLLATVVEDLDLVAPIIPVASIPDLMWEHGHGTPAHRLATARGLSQERFSAAFAPVEVLERAPRVPAERVLVIAGERDRVIPHSHPRRLQTHFGVGEVTTFPGSHLLQFGMGYAFRAITRRAADLGFAPT